MSDGMGERVSDAIVPGWEVVIGLEVHAELATATKLFSTARNEFGGDPNTNVDPVSLGLPGSLPVLNEKAVELAIRVGLALDCEIGRSVFARKNYFYPDMPKDFQISQYELPINGRGRLELPDGRTVGIERAHLEEDTGKSTHVGGGGRIHEADHSLVDYNRARVDCNVSVRREGAAEFGTRCEIKNINSLRSLGRAIEYEARRQVDLIEAGEAVQQQTRHWNEDEGRTHTLRSKEEAYDYRYFPEPDLVPVDPSDEWIAEIRATLPALPRERRHRLAEAAGVDTAAAALTVERGMDDLAVDAIAAGADAARVLVHVENNLADGAGRLDGLESLVDRLIADHPDDWAGFVGGDDKERKKKSGFFVGQVMKATQGQADGRIVNELLERRAAGG